MKNNGSEFARRSVEVFFRVMTTRDLCPIRSINGILFVWRFRCELVDIYQYTPSISQLFLDLLTFFANLHIMWKFNVLNIFYCFRKLWDIFSIKGRCYSYYLYLSIRRIDLFHSYSLIKILNVQIWCLFMVFQWEIHICCLHIIVKKTD